MESYKNAHPNNSTPSEPTAGLQLPKKGLLGQPIGHHLQTRHAVSQRISFPNYCGPPHGSMSHGKEQWLGPGDDQRMATPSKARERAA